MKLIFKNGNFSLTNGTIQTMSSLFYHEITTKGVVISDNPTDMKQTLQNNAIKNADKELKLEDLEIEIIDNRLCIKGDIKSVILNDQKLTQKSPLELLLLTAIDFYDLRHEQIEEIQLEGDTMFLIKDTEFVSKKLTLTTQGKSTFVSKEEMEIDDFHINARDESYVILSNLKCENLSLTATNNSVIMNDGNCQFIHYDGNISQNAILEGDFHSK